MRRTKTGASSNNSTINNNNNNNNSSNDDTASDLESQQRPKTMPWRARLMQCCRMTQKSLLFTVLLCIMLIRIKFPTALMIPMSPKPKAGRWQKTTSKENLRPTPKKTVPVITKTKVSNVADIWEEFWTRYGGEEAASKLLFKGILSFGTTTSDSTVSSDIQHLAERILHAAATSKRFVLAFGGYSVTVGRGNDFKHSYPFVLSDILSPIFQTKLGVDLVVRNAAIGGTPSFPYGWCLGNFLGDDADVISWDFSMNEAHGGSGLEAYLRHAMLMNEKQPMFVLLDSKPVRTSVLQKYVSNGSIHDPIAVKIDVADKTFLQMKDSQRPTGYQHWDEWGSPKGAPGQASWHPKYMQHQMIGWMIAMHFVKGLTRALDIIETDADWKTTYSKPNKEPLSSLPTPLVATKTDANPIFFGTPSKDNDNRWKMNHVSCRTSFKPVLKGMLSDIITEGVYSPVSDPDTIIERERTTQDYESGWVMDVGKLEKTTKKKVLHYGGLGYIDMKSAIYGISKSGTLKLWLPHEEGDVNVNEEGITESMNASDLFQSLVLCEVNEKRGKDECAMEKDLTIVIGGINATNNGMMEGTAYLGKPICLDVNIPSEAKLSQRPDDSYFGLSVDISVNNDKLTPELSCSLSHVLWVNLPPVRTVERQDE